MRRLLLALTLLTVGAVHADQPSAELPIYPRASALGGACGACRLGVESLWYNPAGLLGPSWQASVGTLSWADMGLQGLQAMIGQKDLAAAVGYQGFNLDEPGRDDLGKPMASFSYSERVLSVGMAFGQPELAFGVAFHQRSLHWQGPQQAPGGREEAPLFDLGVLGQLPWQGWDYGVSLRGFNLEEYSRGEPGCYFCLPQYRATKPELHAGFGGGLRQGLQLLGDAAYDSARARQSWHLGLEQSGALQADSRWALRGGWNSELAALGGMGGLSAGLGLTWRGWAFDYAYSSLGDLGMAHRASLAVSSH